jgi:hypothetical protein
MEQGYYLTQIADHTGRLHNKPGCRASSRAPAPPRAGPSSMSTPIAVAAMMALPVVFIRLAVM